MNQPREAKKLDLAKIVWDRQWNYLYNSVFSKQVEEGEYGEGGCNTEQVCED